MPILTPFPSSPLPSHPSVGDVNAPIHASLRNKSLSFFFSFVFIINQIFGPGVLAIPIVFQQSGIFFTIIFLCLFCFIACLSATTLCQAIALIPGNKRFDRRFEFASSVKYYWGKRAHVVAQLLLNICIQSYNLASIVICAQSADQALLTISGKTYALNLAPNPGFKTIYQEDFDAMTNANFILSITLGYLIITVLFLPTCFQNLDDNVKTVQLASFIFFIVIMLEFVIYFLYEGSIAHHTDNSSTPPAAAGAPNAFHPVSIFGNTYTQLVSVFIFSWSFTMFVPSWLNEKNEPVSVNRVIWGAGIVALAGYIAIGWLCAAVEDDIALDNILPLLAADTTPLITRIFAHAFALTIIAPGICVCSVTTRYNLIASKLTGRKWAYCYSAILPFCISFIFSSGAVFASLLVWSSLLFNGVVNFLIPFALYYTAVKRWKVRQLRREGKQQNVEYNIHSPSKGDDPVITSMNAQSGILAAAPAVEHNVYVQALSKLVKDPVVVGSTESEEEDEEEEDDLDYAEGDRDSPRFIENRDEAQAHMDAEGGDSTTHSSSPSGGLTSDQLAAHHSASIHALETPFLPPSYSSDSLASSTVAFVHLPSAHNFHEPVYPYSHAKLRRYAVPLTIAIFAITFAFVIAQIIVDLYYLIGLHENLLSG